MHPSSEPPRYRVIYNPSARGEKARRLQSFLEQLPDQPELRATTGRGSARALACEAVQEGIHRLIAAGGDGTAFEVLNGMADADQGWSRCVLGVLPLGTANVLAHELGMPLDLESAWGALRGAEVVPMDVCRAEFRNERGDPERAFFAIVAGAGLDARAVQQVRWELKRRWGKLAYVWAALQAWLWFRDRVRCTIGDRRFAGRVVLAGNGRRYAGNISMFADGALDSGRLHVRSVDRITPLVLWRCFRALLTGRWDLGERCTAATVTRLDLEGEGQVPLQLDGEFVGWLPAQLSVVPGAIRVLRPR